MNIVFFRMTYNFYMDLLIIYEGSILKILFQETL